VRSSGTHLDFYGVRTAVLSKFGYYSPLCDCSTVNVDCCPGPTPVTMLKWITESRFSSLRCRILLVAEARKDRRVCLVSCGHANVQASPIGNREFCCLYWLKDEAGELL